MPVRHSSHQLEDQSRLAFQALLPQAWVVRSKQPDYGVDLEVEIFKETGAATGLTFNVQLRATANANKARKARMDVAQLAYFATLDVPTAIVRFCQATGETWWCWHFNRPLSNSTTTSKSQTIAFSMADLWTDRAPQAIAQTLALKRQIAALPQGGRLAMRRPEAIASPDSRFAIDSALDRLVRSVRWLDDAALDEPPFLTLCNEPRLGALSLAVGAIAMTTIESPAIDAVKLLGQLAYALSGLLRELGLKDHAADLARFMLAEGLPHDDRTLAAMTCLTLVDEPVTMARLAILNDLAQGQDPSYALIMVGLCAPSAADNATRTAAAEMIFDHAADAAKHHPSPEAEAATFYSRGNFYRNIDQPRAAFRAFRQALRLWPAYLGRPYFRAELGSALFCAGRYRDAARLYRSLPDQESSAVQRRLADALFFSGDVGEAGRLYEALKVVSKSAEQSADDAVRSWVCGWLSRRHGERVPHSRARADSAVRGIQDAENNGALFENIVLQVDALHPLANFNVAVRRAANRAYDDAWAGFMICALHHSLDIGAWVSALQCAMNIKEPTIVIATLSAAAQAAGPAVYETFRSDMTAQGHPVEAVAAMDEVARGLRPAKRDTHGGLTLRVLSGLTG